MNQRFANQPAPCSPCPRSQPEAVERLLVRLLPRASPKTLHTGDVVAFRSPLTVAAAAGAGVGGLGGFAAAALEPELLQVGSSQLYSRQVYI